MNLRAAGARADAFVMVLLLNDRRLFGGLVLALSLRLAILPVFSDPLNYYGFSLTASFALDGQNPWVSIASDPAVSRLNPWGYPPLYLLPTFGATGFSLGNGFAFGLLFRLPLIAATLATGVFLYRTALELGQGESRARVLALGYVFCPFTLLVDTVWGANDPLAIVCVAGALYFLVRKAPRLDLAALLLGLGIAFKLYPLLLLPIAVAGLPSPRARLRFLAFAALPGAITAGPVLLLSPGDFLRTIGLFTVGNGTESATMSITWLLREATGVHEGWIPTGLLVAYGLGIAALAWRVHKGKISMLHASTFTMVGLFLAAPRVNPDYYLWTLPFIALSAGSGAWKPIERVAATLSWVPVLAVALIYNGASGVTGLLYWAQVAGAPPGQPYREVPGGTLPALVFLFLFMVGYAGVSLAWRAWRGGPFELPALRERMPTPLAAIGAKRARAVVALGLALCVVLSAAVASLGVPVRPEDFGSYHTRDHKVTVTDDFRGGLFGFTYTFSGSGYFELDETGSGWIDVDTGARGANAYLSRLLPNQTVEVELRACVEVVYALPGTLEIARIPAGWIGIQTSLNSTGLDIELVFLDEATGILQGFGPVMIGQPLDFSMTLSPAETLVRYAGLTARGSGAAPSVLVLGHPDSFSNGGGRVGFDRLQLSWDANPAADAPGLLPALLATGTLGAAIPVWWWRRRQT